MEAVEKHSYPTRSESMHVRSSTATGTPSRPLTRKNQTRRSLNAMEKQAGDLYDFLSELENMKSAGTQQLQDFLEHSERCDKYPDSMSGRATKPTTSVRDRLKQYSAGGEKKRNVPTAKEPTARQKPAEKVSKTPRPPTRSDSMKRLELARSKHLAAKSGNRPLSPKNKASCTVAHETIIEVAPPATGLTRLEEEETDTMTKSSKIGLEIVCSKSASSASSSNEETMHLSSESENEVASHVRPVSKKSDPSPEDSVPNDVEAKSPSVCEKESKAVVSNQSSAVMKIGKGRDYPVVEVSVVKPREYNETNKESIKEKPSIPEKKVEEKKEQVEPQQAQVGKGRSRNRGQKPDLPPKPPGIESPTSSPRSVRRARRMEEQRSKVSESASSRTRTAHRKEEGRHDQTDRGEVEKQEEDAKPTDVDDLRAKRRARRRNRNMEDEASADAEPTEQASVG